MTLDVPEDLYRHFEDGARRTNRTTAELIGQALASCDLPYERRRGSVRRLKFLDLGAVLRPLTLNDDLLEEMLDA